MLSESQDREREAGGGPPAQPDAGRASPLRFLASLLFTLTGNLYLVFGTLFFAILSTSTGWIPLPHGGRLWFVWARWWSRLLLWSSGVLVRVEQLAPLDRRQVYVFLSNHQSLFDIPVLLATLPVPARFLAKRELFNIPLLGWSLKVGGFIPVERGGKSAGESFRAAAQRVQSGGSVLLFPEETRSPDGRLLPFKRGGFLLAIVVTAFALISLMFLLMVRVSDPLLPRRAPAHLVSHPPGAGARALR